MEKNELLVKAARKELEKLKKKKLTYKSIEHFNEIIRIFLKERYKISRGLTIQEVLDKIPSKRIPKKEIVPWIKLLFETNEISYNSKRPPKKKFFNSLISEAEKIFELS